MHDLYLKPEKCKFLKWEIKYLGVIVGNGVLKMNPKKLESVKNWAVPNSPTEIRKFLGFTRYYRYFVPNYSQIAQPLLHLTKKTTPWEWTQTQQLAFDLLKALMCKAPVLIQPNFEKKFFLQVNASAYGVGTVLLQEGETTTPSLEKWQKPALHLIAFYSATFTPTKQNYDIYNRELLAVMKALYHRRPYLAWTKEPFTILMDHANLTYWKAPRKLDRRHACWHADLEEYDFKMIHIPGNTNGPADALSRPPGTDRGENNNQDVVMIPPHCIRTAITLESPSDQFLRNVLWELHDHPTAGHPGRDETLRKIKELYQWPKMNQWITDYIKGCATCQKNKIQTHRRRTLPFGITTTPDMKPFSQITLDLITGLPQVNGKNTILTIVNHGCSRVAAFIPCTTNITGPGIAQLYL